MGASESSINPDQSKTDSSQNQRSSPNDPSNQQKELDNKLIRAVRVGTVDEVKQCHKQGANINVKQHIKFKTVSLLYVAISRNNLDIIKYLVDSSNTSNTSNTMIIAEPVETDTAAPYLLANRMNAIRCAIEFNHLDIIKYFIEKYGLQTIDQINIEAAGESTLEIAVYYNKYDIVVHLVEMGANVNCQTKKSCGLVDLALKYHDDYRPLGSNRAIAEYLLKQGGDPHVRTLEWGNVLYNSIDRHANIKQNMRYAYLDECLQLESEQRYRSKLNAIDEARLNELVAFRYQYMEHMKNQANPNPSDLNELGYKNAIKYVEDECLIDIKLLVAHGMSIDKTYIGPENATFERVTEYLKNAREEAKIELLTKGAIIEPYEQSQKNQ